MYISRVQDKTLGERGGKERPWPYLLGHIPMERLFISLSHLQHSDTAAVKDSLPHDTSSRRDDSKKQEAHKSYNQTNLPSVYVRQCAIQLVI